MKSLSIRYPVVLAPIAWSDGACNVEKWLIRLFCKIGGHNSEMTWVESQKEDRCAGELMLKITGHPYAARHGMLLVVEGRLAGPWVKELEIHCLEMSENQQQCVMIDLTNVTFIDAEGKALLTRLWQEGVELRASGCLTRCVVEEIQKK